MAVCVRPPLVVPQNYDPMFKVEILLHEPTLARVSTRAEIGADMLALCTQLDILCEKELFEHGGNIQNGKTSTSFTNKVRVIEDKMRHVLIKDRSLPSNLYEYMEKTGIVHMFPYPAAVLKNPSGFNLAAGESDTSRLIDHLNCVSQLNQLSSLCHQINVDLQKSLCPKYLAHQLAILYNCMSSASHKSGALEVFRKSIEDNFKVVKEVMTSSTQQEDTVVSQIREWVLDLTSQVSGVLESMPAELTKATLLPARLLQHWSTPH